MVTLLIDASVVDVLDLAVSFGRDDGFCSLFLYHFNKMIGIVALVGQQGVSFDAFNEIMSKNDVIALSGRADQTNWKAERVCGGVDLGA